MVKLSDKNIITQVSGASNKPVPRFKKEDFVDAIEKQGYRVIHEKAVQCPCRGRNSDQLSNCRNCGGAGWLFINATETKMVVMSMSLNPKYESWGVYGAEFSSITANAKDKLSFMDRVTVMDAITEFSEVCHLEEWSDNTMYAYTVYPIKEVYFVGMFVANDQPLLRITEENYTIDYNKIIINSGVIPAIENPSFTIRYTHNPQYLIQEMVRDTMVSVTGLPGDEKRELMPIHARAKRADLLKDWENYTGDRLLDNSFAVCHPDASGKNKNC